MGVIEHAEEPANGSLTMRLHLHSGLRMRGFELACADEVLALKASQRGHIHSSLPALSLAMSTTGIRECSRPRGLPVPIPISRKAAWDR